MGGYQRTDYSPSNGERRQQGRHSDECSRSPRKCRPAFTWYFTCPTIQVYNPGIFKKSRLLVTAAGVKLPSAQDNCPLGTPEQEDEQVTKHCHSYFSSCRLVDATSAQGWDEAPLCQMLWLPQPSFLVDASSSFSSQQGHRLGQSSPSTTWTDRALWGHFRSRVQALQQMPRPGPWSGDRALGSTGHSVQ